MPYKTRRRARIPARPEAGWAVNPEAFGCVRCREPVGARSTVGQKGPGFDGPVPCRSQRSESDGRRASARRENQYPGTIGSQKLRPRNSRVAESATARSTPAMRNVGTEVASNMPSPRRTIPIVRKGSQS